MILITYDLKSDHSRVRKDLKALGWKDVINGTNGVICHLPNTSLWKDGLTTGKAREEVRSVVKEPTLQRLICVEFTYWAAIKGEEFES